MGLALLMWKVVLLARSTLTALLASSAMDMNTRLGQVELATRLHAHQPSLEMPPAIPTDGPHVHSCKGRDRTKELISAQSVHCICIHVCSTVQALSPHNLGRHCCVEDQVVSRAADGNVSSCCVPQTLQGLVLRDQGPSALACILLQPSTMFTMVMAESPASVLPPSPSSENSL